MDTTAAPTVQDTTAPVTTSVRLGANQYGKAEVRLVRVTRDTDRHEIEDLTVTTQLRGAALAESYTEGDNAKVVATDTQKNTVYAFAKEHGVGTPEEFPAPPRPALRDRVRLVRRVDAVRRAARVGAHRGRRPGARPLLRPLRSGDPDRGGAGRR